MFDLCNVPHSARLCYNVIMSRVIYYVTDAVFTALFQK